MKFIFLLVFLTSISSVSSATLNVIPLPQSLLNLRSECSRLEEDYPDFACLRFEFYQSSAVTMKEDLEELVNINEYELRTSNWAEMMSMLMASLDGQIYRYKDPDDIETLRRTKSKNQWELLKLKNGLRDFWVDPHTYWYPSVDAISFIAINPVTYQILVISHGERN